MQHHGKLQSIFWVAIGLVLIAAVVTLIILLNRPENRAYRDAILVCTGVAAL